LFDSNIEEERGIRFLSVEQFDMDLSIEIEQEEDGRWIAEVTDLPGVLAYGRTRGEAVSHAKALALRVLAERIEHGEVASSWTHLTFREAA
jgi:predicted RNase H-like HicB family nuclease